MLEAQGLVLDVKQEEVVTQAQGLVLDVEQEEVVTQAQGLVLEVEQEVEQEEVVLVSTAEPPAAHSDSPIRGAVAAVELQLRPLLEELVEEPPTGPSRHQSEFHSTQAEVATGDNTAELRISRCALYIPDPGGPISHSKLDHIVSNRVSTSHPAGSAR